MASDDPFVGKVLGDKYTLRRRIARGGHSSIYQADAPDGPVAIKVLHASREQTPESIERMRREGIAIRRLQHPNVVHLLDCDQTADGSPWLAMELLEGESLGARLDRVGTMSEMELLEILTPICEALEHAHRRGIVHRDLKPQNIMLTNAAGAPVPKLLDFGIAGLNDADSLTATENVSGTPMYMPPEQWDGLKFADERSDIYALGVIAYRALSGKFPFIAETPLGWMKKSSFDAPVDLAAALGSRVVSANVCDAIMKALAKDPRQRPQTPMELLRALRPPPHTSTRLAPRAWLSTAVAVVIAAVLGGGVGFRASRIGQAQAQASATAGAPRNRPPIVVLMDTPVAPGVYDAEVVARGGTNADTLNDVLRDLPIRIEKETLPSTWNREVHVVGMQPDVVIIHRSAFFHSLNHEFGYGYGPFDDDKLRQRWELLYRTAEDKLVGLIGLVGTVHPHTRFLVYSRGTGGRGWPQADYRNGWVTQIEHRFPTLRGRITAMMIEGGVEDGSFKNPAVAGEVRRHLQAMLQPPRR